ncbi:MAG: hypothetical protein ACR65R_12815 [Methylomicrobium sp.]
MAACDPIVVLRLIQVYFHSSLTYGLMKLCEVPFNLTRPEH